MKFRPCIDIHNGKVKQIVGGSLKDAGDTASENFVSGQDASFYAALYRDSGIKGGHVILLNAVDSPYFEATREQALHALRTYPGGLQLGGGVCPKNAELYLNAGASHVIVTSYVFKNGRISWENLEKLERAAGRERLVLDLSCRKKRRPVFYCNRPLAEVYGGSGYVGKHGNSRRPLRRIFDSCSRCGRKGRRDRNRAGRAFERIYKEPDYLCRRSGRDGGC